MKQFNIKWIAFVACLTILGSCKKEVPTVWDGFTTKIEFQFDNGKLPVDGQVTISGSDSLIINYTLENPDQDIYGVAINKAGDDGATNTILATPARKVTGTYKFYARNLGAGQTTYRIWAIDRKSIYMGDGGKKITINVADNFVYYTNRYMYLMDNDKKMECFAGLSLDAEGKIWNFADAKANAARVDFYFGFVRIDTVVKVPVDPAVPAGAQKDSAVTYFPWALLSPDFNPVIAYNDMSTWSVRKRTLFANGKVGPEPNASAALFKTRYSTTDTLVAIGAKKTYDQNWIRLTSWDEWAKGLVELSKQSNKFIHLKTAEGKYGVIFVNIVKFDPALRRTYFNVSWKLQS
jgi:hypothetical protein